MSSRLSSASKADLQAIADSYLTKDNGIPGLVFCVVDRNGTLMFDYAGGVRGHGRSAPVDQDTLFWFASCTKLITAIAAMQLVERNAISLDDGDQLERFLWELKDRKVLQENSEGGLTLVEKESKITLRMLLSHTAGFGYSFSNPKLKKWSEPAGITEVSSKERDIFDQPLVNQPGTIWEYGVNMDWVGRLVERVSFLPLGDYVQKHILAPLGISSITFSPSSTNLAYMHERTPDGLIQIRDGGHLLSSAINTNTSGDTHVEAGGHGLFGSPKDYCQILSVLINGGVHAPTGARILGSETITSMMENQIPEQPNFARDLDRPCKPSLVNFQEETYPQPREQAQGWGLSFFKLIHSGETGRAAGTVWWSGLANLIWWADAEIGIGGMLATQILPFCDSEVFACYDELEKMLYEAIQ